MTPFSEKSAMLTTSTIDLHWVIERSLSVWPSSNIWDGGQSGQDVTQPSSSESSDYVKIDNRAVCLWFSRYKNKAQKFVLFIL